jgi:CheY-like chemotaxis protein
LTSPVKKGKKVLAISSNQRELLIINDSLKKEGFEVLRALNGPSALEIALKEVPDLIVLVDELQIIEPLRIAEILKSNPVLEGVPFIFVGFGGMKLKTSPKDRIIKKPVEEPELVQTVRKIFKIEEKAPGEEETAKKGTLKEGEIADFLMVLANQGSDGTLILSKGGQKGYVYFEKGNIINASIDKIEGEKALYRLLGWKECEYEFVPVRALTPVRIKRPSNVVLIDAVRQMEEFEAMRSKLPMNELFVIPTVDISSLPSHASPLVKEIILLTEIYKKVEDIVNACSYPDIQVLKAIAGLAKKGLIKLKSPPKKRKVEEPIIFPDNLQRLKEKVMGGKGEISRRAYARLIIFCGAEETAKKFKLLASKHSAIAFSDKKIEYFTSIGTINVGENIKIEIIFLRPDESYLPLYTLIKFKTIGGIYLITDLANEIKTLEKFHEYMITKMGIPFRLCAMDKKDLSSIKTSLLTDKITYLKTLEDLRSVLNEVIGETFQRF